MSSKAAQLRTNVRFDELQWQKINDMSEQTGYTIPELLRKSYFDKSYAVPKLHRDDVNALKKEVNRLGVNINQIARHYNTFSVLDHTTTLKKILKEMDMLNDHMEVLNGLC